MCEKMMYNEICTILLFEKREIKNLIKMKNEKKFKYDILLKKRHNLQYFLKKSSKKFRYVKKK